MGALAMASGARSVNVVVIVLLAELGLGGVVANIPGFTERWRIFRYMAEHHFDH